MHQLHRIWDGTVDERVLKGIGSPDKYFLRPIKLNQDFLCKRKGFYIFACVVEEVNKYKDSACFLDTLTKRLFQKPNFDLSFPSLSLSLVHFLQCTFMTGFRNNSQNHKRLSEQLFES